MGSFFELALVSIKPEAGRQGRWFSAKKPRLAQCTKDGTPPSTNSRQGDEAIWTTSTPALTRLITLFVAEAVSSIEHGLTTDRPRNGCTDSSTACDQGRGGTGKPLAFSSNILWAMWVLDVLLLLESTYGGMEGSVHGSSDENGDDSSGPIGPVMKGEAESLVSEDARSLRLAVASARSPRAFAAVLRTIATGNSAGGDLRVMACSLCAHMLDLSRLAPRWRRSSAGLREDEASADDATAPEVYHHASIPSSGPTKEEYALPLQESLLAREFSTRLRTQVSMQSLGSPSLQSQLELLAQWELRRSIASGKRYLPSKGACTRRFHDDNCKKKGPMSEGSHQTGTDKHSVPEVWIPSTCERTDGWDVATASCSGVEEASDNNSRTTQVKKYETVGSNRSDTAESEAPAPSTVPTISGKDSSAQNQNMSLLVETASATSVTVSWGGWLGTNHGSELQVGIGSNGIAYPMACGREPGASDLAQALRSKLSHAASRRQGQESGLVLKVKY